MSINKNTIKTSIRNSIRNSIDPRYYQLAVQTCLLLWGCLFLQFPVTLWSVLVVLVSALATQWLFCYRLGLPMLFLSTLNTSFSVLLLLHATTPLWLALAVSLSIASKFLIRFDGQHVFNPSNFGIVITILLTYDAWAAPGQWGQGLWLALLLAGCGSMWLLGWRLSMTTLSFLVSYCALLFLRAYWLGDPWQIPLHQLQNGSLLIFAFFMLSDPKTTPQHPLGRAIFGFCVAFLAAYLQFHDYLTNAFLYALLLVSPSAILLNKWWNYPRFEWSQSR